MNKINIFVIIFASFSIASSAWARQSQSSVEPPAWNNDILHWRYSPVDLSFMNKDEIPAGKRGFLRTRGDELIFEDGTKAKFWGTNIQAYALFRTAPNEMKSQAKRISQLGYNLVRIHHHDSSWVSPNIFGDPSRQDTLTLNRESLKILDLWINVLKSEGIYIWLDLHVGRDFTENDGIKNFSEISKGKERTTAKGFTYIDNDIRDLMKNFNDAYLNHVSPYSNLAYKDDPAIISVLITNENDVTHHFGNALLPDKNVPVANEIYMKKAHDFATKHGLSPDRTWRSWEHGPSKIFLSDLEHEFNLEIISHLREIELKPLVTTTNSWGRMPLSSLPSLTDSDIVDAHTYGKTEFLSTNPRLNDNFISWIGAAQVNEKPLSVTEWNIEEFPAYDRFSSAVYLAGTSALQGWDALMQYGYGQVPLNNEGRPSNWGVYNDPGSLALMPAAALIYRQGHVSPAKTTYALVLDQNTFFNTGVSPTNSATIRTLVEQSKLVISVPKTKELPWLKSGTITENTEIISDYNKDFIPEGQNFVSSDTGEITRDWANGVYTINTENSQLATGKIGGKSIRLGDLEIQLITENAAVAAQSLDNIPLKTSEKILISLAGRSKLSAGNKLPYLSEPIIGVIAIAAKEGMTLFGLNKYGKEFELPTIYSEGRYQINLDNSVKSYWLLLRK